MKTSLGAGRWWLWSALCVLLLALLGSLVFLARAYEDQRLTSQLEHNAADIVGEIRNGLALNALALQGLHESLPAQAAWRQSATALLLVHREILRLEWRTTDLQIRQAQASPFLPQLFEFLPRSQAQPDVQQACANARRFHGPAYSTSYFLPLEEGRGQELMEMCLPLLREGREEGFLIATYGLSDMLSELIRPDTRRNRSIALTESDGARLSILGTVPREHGVIHAAHSLELPGSVYMLRVERARQLRGLLPNVLTSGVTVLALALVGVLALFALDVRKRLHAEARLSEALAFRQAMEDSLLSGLRARDMRGRITYVNPAFCQLVGLPAEQLIGSSNPAPYWPPDRVDEYLGRETLRHSGEMPARQGFEAEYLRPDGIRVPVLIVEAPLINEVGKQTGWMSAVVDLSAQRRVEEQSRASQERLQATARLAMAGEMASLISHELNQPLAAIASYASGTLNLLHEPELPLESLREDLDVAIRRIADQAARAGRVIKSVSDLVRRRERSRSAVPVQELFDGITPLVQLQARKSGIKVEWLVAPDCPPVWCDATMVEQVLLNLARNGLQAMPAGDPPPASGLRTLQLHAAPAPGHEGSERRWVAFAVTDHGKGLSDEVAKRLFTPFFTTRTEGMGLGLSLCRTVVEQHGGALGYERAEPRGTVFRFTLPAAP